MQKVIIILVAIFCFASTTFTTAQVATTVSDTTIAKTTKQDTLIVTNPNTVIIVYQTAKVPVVYAQPDAKQLAPISATKPKNTGARAGKVVLSAVVGGFTGMVLGGAIAYSNALNGDIVDVFFSPFTTILGAGVGSLVGTGAGLCVGFALK